MSEDAGNRRCEDFRSFSIYELVDSALAMLPERNKAAITTDIAAEELVITGPIRSISRTIKELIKNAFDACANVKEPDICLSVRQEGRFVVFTVSDNGTGIEEGMTDKLTEPFFTTKEPGKGMGLGLYLAGSIAEQFGGRLEISDSNRQGARVSLLLALDHLSPNKEEQSEGHLDSR